MTRSVYPVITKLFADADSSGPTRDFAWRLIRRRRRPFLLLPVSEMSTRVNLTLYSAQRRRAKIWRALLPLVLNSPAAMIFHRVSFTASQTSDILRFLSEQSGVPVDRLPSPAIKFGGIESQKSRLVLLACDTTNRPIKVIKLGLDAAGRAATDREADFLAKLPANSMGCIRVTGRMTTPNFSAFATDYFPGESPDDDLGMETLFESWINSGPVVAIETLDAWRELETKVAAAAPTAWQALRQALAGKKIHSTLYHGDFAPWNIRAVNMQNLQVFDWERGNFRGFPGWDWFHFVVQTSVLARRHSPERVAAEVEELLLSPRFEKYARSAGIHDIVKPLVLAYLLHHRWVIRPLEGGKQAEELHELLVAHWNFTPRRNDVAAGQFGASSRTAPAPRQPGLWADARRQLKAATSQLANVFWEPTLTAEIHPSLSAHIKSFWPWILLCSGWLAAMACIQYFYINHVMLLPFQAIPILLIAWKMNRRWGTLFALLAAPLGPLVAAAKEDGAYPAGIVCWNSIMRFIILQMCVFLADRIHRQENFFRQLAAPRRRHADFAGNWAVVVASCAWFLIIAWGDLFTGPRVSFLPLYLFPAILITLFLNLRWGAFVALLGALVASADEYKTNFNANAAEVFCWNLPMRFLILYIVILLVDRLRNESVLFTSRKRDSISVVGEAR